MTRPADEFPNPRGGGPPPPPTRPSTILPVDHAIIRQPPRSPAVVAYVVLAFLVVVAFAAGACWQGAGTAVAPAIVPTPTPDPTPYVIQWHATDRPMSCFYVQAPNGSVASLGCYRDMEDTR